LCGGKEWIMSISTLRRLTEIRSFDNRKRDAFGGITHNLRQLCNCHGWGQPLNGLQADSLDVRQAAGRDDEELPLGGIAMIGAVVVDTVMGEDIEMGCPAGFLDPPRTALPISGSGRNIEAGFVGLVRSPGLSGRRLLHFQTQAV